MQRVVEFSFYPWIKYQISLSGVQEKSVPRDHRLSSLGKPRDAKRRSSGRIFLSHLTLMILL